MAAAAPASAAAKDKDVKQPAGAAGAGAGAGLSTDAAAAGGKADAAVTTRAPIAARFALLCGKPELSDVTFVVGKNGDAKIPAHRFILAARSPIFEALLYHPVRPHLKLSKPIVVKDVEPDAFMCMLRCIYSDKPGLNHENILGASRCAKKYQVESLRVACVQFSKKGITAATACGLYDRSPELALEFIEQNASKVFASAGFRALSERSVIGLLRSNKLDIAEPKLFRHVLAWGKAECERRGLDAEKPEVLREVLKNVILGVRFPLFSTAQLSTHVTKLNLLTPDQLLGVFSVVGGNKTAKCAFSLIPRESALQRFAFDQNKKSPSVTLQTNDTVARLNAKCGYALGARAVKRGVTAWRLTFAMNAPNNLFGGFGGGGGGVPQVTYGISAPKAYFDQRTSYTDPTVYAIDTVNQWFSGGAVQGTQYVTAAVGQSVDVVLDLTARTLSYVNVQTKQRHLIQNIGHSEDGYVLHVHMIRNGAQVTVQTIKPAQAGN